MILEDILHQTLEIEKCERLSRAVWHKHRMSCPLENIAKGNGFPLLDAHQSLYLPPQDHTFLLAFPLAQICFKFKPSEHLTDRAKS